MAALEAHDLEEAQRLTAAEKLGQALEVMRTGIRFKRASLSRQYPDADDAELERRLTEWPRGGLSPPSRLLSPPSTMSSSSGGDASLWSMVELLSPKLMLR